MDVKAKNIFLTLLGYQLTWIFCVFGEYYNISLAGLIMGILYLTIFFYFNNYKLRAFKICFVFSLIGYLFDSILGYSKVFQINSNIMVGYLPIWFLILWPSFSTLFVNILSFLKNHPILAFFMGSSFAPPTYYLGIPLGIAKSSNLSLAIIIMIIFWGLFLTLYSFYISKNNFLNILKEQ
jgi:hypothetical protein